MNKNKTVPELRFPEFLNEGEWTIQRVGDIFKVTRGYVLAMGLTKTSSDDKYCYPVYSSQTKSTGLAGYYNDYLYENAITWTTDGANAGDVNYRHGKFYCTNVCGVLLNEEGYANNFVAEILNTVTHKHVSYVGNPKLMNGVMSDILIPLPSIAEQQKIANCLSSLDEVIEGHEEKLLFLQDHKRGLMQNLFPKEGETKPKYRFPEFENDEEWEEKKLGEIFNFVRGPFGGALKKEIFVKEGYAVYEQSHAIYNKFNEFRYFIDFDKFLELKRFSVKANDIIMSCSGTMGKFAIIPDNAEKGIINQALLKLSARNKFNHIFMKLTLELDCIQNNLLSQSAGGAIKNVVGVSEIKKILVYTPKESEQQKIADCLTSIDNLITEQTERIEQLKQHKQGLMQGLFPKIEE